MSSDARRAQLVAHLEHVYTLAQVITPDVQQAIARVEETYARAFRQLPLGHDEASDRAWLFRLLLEAHDAWQQHHGIEQPASAEEVEEALADTQKTELGLRDVRHRLAEELIDRLLPAVFATLPNSSRLLLVLCEVEEMSCAEAGAVLDLHPEIALAQLVEVRRKVVRSLYASLRPPERALLEDMDVHAWFKGGLSRTLDHMLTPLPTTLVEQLGASAGTDASEASVVRKDLAHPAERKPSKPRRRQHTMRRLALACITIMVASFAGLFGSRIIPEHVPEVDLVMLTISNADEVEPRYDTSAPEQAERWLASSLGASLTVPEIEDAPLAGVAVQEVADGVEVPVLLFDDTRHDAEVKVFVYSYAQLDEHASRIQLTRDVLEQIAQQDGYNLFDLGQLQVLIWRHTNEIYMAVTPGGGAELRGRIHFPS